MKIQVYLFTLIIVVLFTATGCSSASEEPNSNVVEPPEAIVKIGEEKIETSIGTYEWSEKEFLSNKSTIADADTPYKIAEDMEAKSVQRGSAATIEFDDSSEPQVNAYLWEKENRGKELSFHEGQITLPEQVGRHVIEIIAQWPNGEASYTFVVEIL